MASIVPGCDRTLRAVSTPTITDAHARTFFIVSGPIAVVVLLGTIVEPIRQCSPLILICVVGSILCNPVESVWDALGKLRFLRVLT